MNCLGHVLQAAHADALLVLVKVVLALHARHTMLAVALQPTLRYVRKWKRNTRERRIQIRSSWCFYQLIGSDEQKSSRKIVDTASRAQKLSVCCGYVEGPK